MNQIVKIMKLIDFTKESSPYGTQKGRQVFSLMRDFIEKHASSTIFELSLEGIEFIDSSFTRESIILLAQLYKGKKGFYLSHIEDKDIVDNIDYIAQVLKQPIAIKFDQNIQILGPRLTKANLEIIELIIERKKVTTALVANAFDISVPNASSKLKKLVDDGYILRFEETAESGGIEFIYQAIQ